LQNQKKAMIHNRNDYQTRIQDSENKIPADEPVFLLRAQDETAAAVVRYWIKLNRKAVNIAAKASGDGSALQARKKAIALAEAHAYRMDDWPKKKPADV
jgi:hypothetical protein